MADPDLENAMGARLREDGQNRLEGEVVGGIALPEIAEAFVLRACMDLSASAIRLRHGVLHCRPFDVR